MRVLWLFIILLKSICLPHAYAEILIVGDQYSPYIIKNNNSIKGIFPDIVKAAFLESGIKVDFALMPWVRCEKTIEQGRAFAAMPYLYTSKRAERFDFSDPIVSFYPKFFYLKERFPEGIQFNALDDLKPFLIGGVRGYWYEDTFKEKGLRVDYAYHDKTNMEKLMKKRIELTLVDESVGWHLINQLFPFQKQMDTFATINKEFNSGALHLMISKTYPDSTALKEDFNRGLRLLRERGAYHKIIKQYRLSEKYPLP